MEQEENKGLTGKLTEIARGDRIRIWRTTPGDSYSTYEACGYVTRISQNMVTLSQDSPFHVPRGMATNHLLDIIFGRRKKEVSYDLEYFDYYAKQVDEKQN